MRLRSLAFVVSLIALSATARAQEWANYGTISAEPTAGRICSGDANGKDILCASPAPYVDTSGNLGIGTTTMTGKLNINAPSTQTAANAYGLYVDGAQSTANSSAYVGMKSVPTYTAASGNTLAAFYGVDSNPVNTSTGTVTNMYGVRGIPQNTSTGAVDALYGLFGQPQNIGAGAITTMVGVRGIPQNISTGTVTNMIGFFSRCDNSNASGTVTNCYALYLDTPTTTGAITNKYGVYQVDTNSSNYFAGAVRLAASNYLNWGATAGTSGYGFRDNAGAIEYKNSGGSWTALNAGTATNFAAGTVSAPGLYVTGDSNTGLYQATADSVSITAGGVEAARFNTAASGVNYLAVTPSATTAAVQLSTAGSDTNISLALMPKGTGGVGIGTSAPGATVEVYNGGMMISDNGGSPATLTLWGDRENVNDAGITDARISFRYDNSSDQGFNINAINYTGSGKLVFSSVHAGYAGAIMTLGDGTTTGQFNVGIGTDTPAEKLQVSGNIKVAGTIQTADASATCSVAADLGKFRYNTSTGKFQICK